MQSELCKVLRRVVSFFLALIFCVRLGAAPIVESRAIAIVDDIAIGVVLSLLAVTGVVFATEPDARAGAVQAYKQGTAAFRGLVDDVGSKVITGATSIAMAPAALLSVLKSTMQTFPADKTTVPNAALLGTMPMDGSVLLSGAYPVLGTSSDTTVLVFSHPVKGFVFLSVNFANCLSSSGELWVQSTNNALIVSSEFKASGMPHVTKFAVKSLSPSTPLRVSFAGYDSNKQVYGILDFSASQFSQFVGPIDAVKFVGVTTGKFADYWGKDWTGANAPSVDAYPTIGYTADKSVCADGVLARTVRDYVATYPDVAELDIALHPDVGGYVGIDWRDVYLTDSWRRFLDRELAKEEEGSQGGTGEGEGTGEGDAELELPDAGSLTLPAALAGVFPFSIPFDVAKGLECLKAPPTAPVFEVPIKYGEYVDESFTLDFTRWDHILEMIRWFEILCFTVGLAVNTYRLIKW